MATRIIEMRAFTALLLLVPALLTAQPRSADPAPTPASADSSAARFARAFYAWYVPAQARGRVRGVELVLRNRSRMLAGELRRMLVIDSLAQARAAGEIDGLDFDPFLNSQDPCERYEVRRTVRVGARVDAAVYGTCRSEPPVRPDAVLELVPEGASWVLQNIRYAEDRDLLRLLYRLHPSARRTSPVSGR